MSPVGPAAWRSPGARILGSGRIPSLITPLNPGPAVVKKEDEFYSRSIEIGRENLRLLPHVRRWCRHIEVEVASYGLLAQATGLPIGYLRVKCQHGITLSESSFLAFGARGFILHNCVGCVHHEEVGQENFGRDVLAERERGDAQKAMADARRRELREEAFEAAAAALETRRITEGSVNGFILGLFEDEEEACRCEQPLLDAARLGPEFFSNAALGVLSDGFTGAHAEVCLTTARLVCNHRKSVPGGLVGAAIRAVEKRQDTACGLLADAVSTGGNPRSALAALPAVVALPGYGLFHWRNGLTHSRPSYPGTIELLHSLLAVDPDAVRAAFAGRLRFDRKEPRRDAAELLIDLLPAAAEHILPLVPVLLRSFELSDDIYEMSADATVGCLLAHLYAYASDRVEADIEAYMPGASSEVRQLILSVYARIASLGVDQERDRWADSVGFTCFEKDLYARHAPAVTDRLLLALSDLNLGPDARREIAEKLKHLIKAYPAEGLSRLERLLGRLAMTVREADTTPAPGGGDILAALNARDQRSAYDALDRTLVEIVEGLAKVNSREVFEQVRALLDRLGSKVETDERLKAMLVGTLGTFACTYELQPSVIRQLYKHLLDFESRLVRARAIRVAGELLDDCPGSVPDNIVELLTVYLEETYVIIHQAAARALRAIRFARDERGHRVLNALLGWEKVYRDRADETDFLRDIFWTLGSSFRGWSEVRRHIARALLPAYCRLKDPSLAEEMLVRLGEETASYPELAPLFIQLALDHLKNTGRDRYNDDTHTRRGRIRGQLRQMSPPLVAAELERVRALVRAKTGNDPLDVIRILEILSHLGLNTEAAALAEEAFGIVPDVRAHAFERDSYRLTAAAERAELLIAHGSHTEAIRTLKAAVDAPDLGEGRPDLGTAL